MAADAYRHFSLSYDMSKNYGAAMASIIMYGHEAYTDYAYNIKSHEGTSLTMEVRLSTLMDLHNNNQGIYMGGAKGYNAETAFQFSLTNGALITSLDQVPAAFGFSNKLVFTVGNVQYVTVSLQLQNKKGLTYHDFNNYPNWKFVDRKD